MGRFFTAVKRGLGAAADDWQPKRYEAAGRTIVCTHCGHDAFADGKAQLNTAVMTFLDLDWANRSAAILICAECSHIEWFMEKPEAIA